jgi:hypothetical protein
MNITEIILWVQKQICPCNKRSFRIDSFTNIQCFKGANQFEAKILSLRLLEDFICHQIWNLKVP